MPAILDSLFHKVVDTTSSSIRVEGGGWWGATKWRGLSIQENLNGQMTSIQAVWLHISQNVAIWIPSLTNQSCSDFLPAVFLAKQVGPIYRPPEH